MAFFLFIDLVGCIFMWHNDLFTGQTINFSCALAIPMFLGMFVGHRLAAHIQEDALRKIVQILLMILASVGMIRSFMAM